MPRQQLPFLAERQAGVVPFLLLLRVLGDTAADERDFSFFRDGAEDVVAWTLCFTRSAAFGRAAADVERDELLGVFGEVFGAVGAVEALGEDDEFCAGGGGFEDFGAGGGEVGGFVCAGAELD